MALSVSVVVSGQFNANNGAAPQSHTLTGAKVGDIVYSTIDNVWFESVISVDDQIQQTSGPNLFSDNPLSIVLFRPVCS